MATLRNRLQLTAINKENYGKYLSSKQCPLEYKKTTSHRSQINFDGRVTNKLSQEFRKTESRIVGALSWVDEFFLNPIIQCHSGSVPEMSRITHGEDQETKKNCSRNDLHPEARVALSQSSQDCVPVHSRQSRVKLLDYVRLRRMRRFFKRGVRTLRLKQIFVEKHVSNNCKFHLLPICGNCREVMFVVRFFVEDIDTCINSRDIIVIILHLWYYACKDQKNSQCKLCTHCDNYIVFHYQLEVNENE